VAREVHGDVVGPPATSAQTAELLFSCFKRLHRLVDLELAECGLSLSRSKILSELHQQGPLNQRTLAATFSLAPRTMTELIDTLERDGLVERRTDPDDRRARRISLTPAGEQARITSVTIRGRIIERVMGPLSDERLDAVFTALQHVAEELDRIDADNANGGGPGRFCDPEIPTS
jgi:DNA-binding MarR family transcriptional regulator